MKDRFLRALRNASLKSKIFTIVLIVVILLGSVSLVGLQMVGKAADELLYQSTASALSYSATEIAGAMDTAGTLTYLMAVDTLQSGLDEYLKNDEPTLTRSLYYNLYMAVNNSYQASKLPYYKYMTLLFGGQEIHTGGSSAESLPDEIKAELEAAALEAEGGAVYMTKYSETYGLFLVRSVRRIEFLDLEHMGTLVLCIDLGQLASSTQKYADQFEDSAYMLFDEQVGQVIYSATTFGGEVPASVFERDESYFTVKEGGIHYFAVKGAIPRYGWQYVALLDYGQVSATMTAARTVSLVIVGVCILLLLLLSNSLLRSIMRHFGTLMDKMQSFDGGTYMKAETPYDYSERMDELGLIHQMFDAMAERIHHLIEDNYLKELLHREAQLKALEAQLDPHFLYNTLELINWRAKAAGEREISQMVESLGGLLRAILDKTNRMIPLSQEIVLVQNYLTIQKLRFDERVEYRFEIDDRVLNACIPKMTIQPLVENAVRYGLESMEDRCVIDIRARLLGDMLHIIVRNSNSVFDEDILEKLKDGTMKVNGFGIGIMNIYERLQLSYHEDARMWFDNIEDRAVVHITIPYRDHEDCGKDEG